MFRLDGPVIFDGLAKDDCSAGDCLVTVFGTTTCIITIIVDPKRRPEDIFRCAPAEEVRQINSTDRYPTELTDSSDLSVPRVLPNRCH